MLETKSRKTKCLCNSRIKTNHAVGVKKINEKLAIHTHKNGPAAVVKSVNRCHVNAITLYICATLKYKKYMYLHMYVSTYTYNEYR